MRRLLPCILLVGLAACGAPPPYAALPPDAVSGSGDPTRSAILRNGYVFAHPAELVGQPAAAARAIADMEYLAVELPYGPRYVEMVPQVALDLGAARREWRGVLGIAPEVPAQAVIDSLYAVSRGAGEQALPPAAFPQPGLTMARLAALPPLPRTQLAADRAVQELNRIDQMGRTSPGGDSPGGRGS